ncbi:hypothetical protein EGW08_018171 [Elysia chlorotica]|uniref:Uncharacterized protein n=1 Tax=Elysia chlorotica TaxID=188477 RepID=A0A3S0ZBS3_ELYCH|nr:hypothetical protein EGW08_018171 [Elysia chlorotica]
MKEDLPGDGSSFFSAPGYAKSLNRHRADGDQTRWSFRPKAPPSLWSVPPSQRQWPASYVHGSQQRDRPVGVRGPASVSVQATWRGLESREWTYLSVDRLLRDIEMSRRNNPNHSWRDFASLSTEPAQSAKKARRL